MCSGSEAGSYLRLIDFVYHSTLGVRVIKKKKGGRAGEAQGGDGTLLFFFTLVTGPSRSLSLKLSDTGEEMVPPIIYGSEAGSYLRLIDSCITQFKAQGPPRACSESKEEEEKKVPPYLT